MTSMTEFSFVTHLEIEGLLGGGPKGGQQRRRMERKGLMPEPAWIRADRRRLGILPEFALASLVMPRRLDAGHVALLDAILTDTRRLYASGSFKSLERVVREVLPSLDQASVTPGLLECLQDQFRDEYDAWRADIGAAMEKLALKGLRIEAQRGRIIQVRGDAYVVRTSSSGATESHPRSDAPFDLPDGLWVSRDRVHALSSAKDFLLPAAGEPENANVAPAAGEDEAMFEEMFGSLDFTPFSIPRLPWTDEEEPAEDDDAPPRIVRAPVSMLHGITPMTRARD
jgi:hypothetical protein